MSSLCALMVERPSRRNLLCLYVANVATEALFSMACSRGYCRPLPYGQVLIFGASVSILLYYFRYGLHQIQTPGAQGKVTSKDSIYDVLRFVVGRYEEYVPALQLQPQILSRRRERQPSAALLATQRTRNNGPSRNPLLPVVLQAVRYYTQLTDYLKYGLPRHKTCPHPKTSCLYYVLSGGSKLFTIGVGIQVLKLTVYFNENARKYGISKFLTCAKLKLPTD